MKTTGPPIVSTGGGGGLYGGGGGGCGGIRAKRGGFVPGRGADGGIFLTWTPTPITSGMTGYHSGGTIGSGGSMILAADGKPLCRSVVLLNTVGIGYHCGVQLLRQTDGWYRGVKAVWVPNYDGTVHDILWASFDQNEPIPDWVRRVPWFVMATAALTTASVSPWTVDPTWNAASNSVELVGAGGSGAQGTTGSSSSGGGGGAGGNYTKLSNGAISGTVAFKVGVGGTGSGNTNRTSWESDQTGSPANYYFASSGGNASGVTGGTASGVGDTNGTPAITFTVSLQHVGASAATTGVNFGGTGGGGCGGPANNGGAGGNAASGNGGTGGGGANNGVTGKGSDSSGSVTGGPGGLGSSGTGGTGGTTTGNPGTGNSGGEGSDGSASAVNLTGGAGGSGTDFDVTHGLGGGGGGSGQCTSNTTQTSTGGGGGLYGAGGAGTGGCRGTSSTRTIGVGASGLLFLTWTPASFAWFDNMTHNLDPRREPFRAVGGSPTISDRDSPWRKYSA